MPWTLRVSVFLVVFLAAQIAKGQTIPQLLAQENKSLGRSIDIEVGIPPTVESLVDQADIIVEGTLGRPTSYLSADQNDVFTDYPLLNAAYLYPAEGAATPLPGPGTPIIVTQLGGTVNIQGRSFTVELKQLPPLQEGTKCVFLLKRVDGKFHIVGRFLGVFRSDRDVLEPLAKIEEFAPDVRTTPRAVVLGQWTEFRKATQH